MTGEYKGTHYTTHPYIEEYFRIIRGGDVKMCREQNMMHDFLVKKLSQTGVFIDDEKIAQAMSIKEKYFYKEFPYQKFIDCFIYGVFNADGTPMFNRFFIMMGRGNGKNGYISPNIWYMTTKGHGVRNYNVELVANSENQVKTSFEDVANMLENPDYNEKMKTSYTWTKEIIKSKSTASVIRWHTSNAKTKDSLRSGCIVFDEVHQYEDYDQINVFMTGLGKIPSSRVFWITTDGFVRGKVLDDYKQEALETLTGERPNSRTFFFICKLDKKEEVDNPEMWEKANPSWRYLPDLRLETMQEYEDSKNNHEVRRGFITKRMNIPAQDAATPVTEWENILATNQEPQDFSGAVCIGGLDFAETTDYVGCGLLFRKGAKYYWLHHTFICAGSLLKVQPKFPIKEAVKKGLCTIVNCKNIPAEMIAGWFKEKSNIYSLLRVVFDEFREPVVKSAFIDAGIPTETVRRGWFTHMKIAPLLDILYAEHNIVYMTEQWEPYANAEGNSDRGDFMMRWYTNNVCKEYDKKGNVSYEKIEPIRRKTDGFFGFLAAMCSDFKTPLPDGTPVRYEEIRTYVY